jgi:ABC-2 type transport system permease protein
MNNLSKLTLVELKLFFRDPLAMVFVLAIPAVFFLVIGEIFGDETVYAFLFRGVGAVDFYLPAYYGLVAMSAGTVVLPAHLARYRENGTLLRLRSSAFSQWTIMGAQLMAGILIILIGSALVTVIAVAFYQPDMPVRVLQLIFTFLLGAVCFGCFGLFLGTVVKSARSAAVLGLALFGVMFVLGGAGPPPVLFSGVLEFLGKITPLYYVVRMMQNPWIGYEWYTGATIATAAITLVSAVIAARFFRWQ